MKRIYFWALIPGLLAIIWGCECVPGIDTPKIIEPTESANVLFIHALPDLGRFDIESKLSRFSDFTYGGGFTSYYKININDNIRLLQTNGELINTLYRASLDLSKGKYYTLIFYGGKSRIREILLSDTIQNFNQASAFLRIANVALDINSLKVILSRTIEPITIPYSSFTGFFPVDAGSYKIEVRDVLNDTLIAESPDANLINGKAYTLIMEGYYGREDFRKVKCRLVQNDLH